MKQQQLLVRELGLFVGRTVMTIGRLGVVWDGGRFVLGLIGRTLDESNDGHGVLGALDA